MKELMLDPWDCLHSHGLGDLGGLGGLEFTSKLRALEQAILDDTWDEVPPVYVVQSEDLPGKYLLYNGNHRLHIATLFNKPLKAKLIESDEDLKGIPNSEVALWAVAPWYEDESNVPGYVACLRTIRRTIQSGLAAWSSPYEYIVLKIRDWTLHCSGIPTYETGGICWDTPNKSRLEELLDKGVEGPRIQYKLEERCAS